MRREMVNECLMCGSHKKTQVFCGNDLLQQGAGHFPMVSCSDCGFLYLGERPSLDSINEYYPVDYLSYQKAIEDERSLLKRLERSYERHKRVQFVQRHAPQKGCILDVGCATGIFLDGMRSAGWSAVGVEPSSFAAEYARSRYQLEIVQGFLHDANFPDNRFDVVTMWDVLEHTPNPMAILEETQRILKPGGILVIGVPNPESWERRLYGRYWPGWDIPRHFFLFRARDLRSALELRGMEWLGVESFMGKHGTLVLALQFWLARQNIGAWLTNGILKAARSPITRILTLPFYTLATRLNKSSYMTIVSKNIGNG